MSRREPHGFRLIQTLLCRNDPKSKRLGVSLSQWSTPDEFRKKGPAGPTASKLDTPSPSVKRGKIATARFIAETAHAVAIYQPGEGDVLYITFNSENERAKGLGFSGDRLLRRLGRPAIGIMSTVANWYPKTAMASILAAAQAVIGEGEFSHVICFGHGMGGYGALRFAAELQAEVAIAFSPITTIDPGQTSVPNKFWPRIDPSFEAICRWSRGISRSATTSFTTSIPIMTAGMRTGWQHFPRWNAFSSQLSGTKRSPHSARRTM
jgi:pimeloyl-ACP methyl ester carboxylesterase